MLCGRPSTTTPPVTRSEIHTRCPALTCPPLAPSGLPTYTHGRTPLPSSQLLRNAHSSTLTYTHSRLGSASSPPSLSVSSPALPPRILRRQLPANALVASCFYLHPVDVSYATQISQKHCPNTRCGVPYLLRRSIDSYSHRETTRRPVASMAITTAKQNSSSIAMALAGKSHRVDIPRPNTYASAAATGPSRSGSGSQAQGIDLPTPPASISPSLPPQAYQQHKQALADDASPLRIDDTCHSESFPMT